jgi:hypothetical protein
MNLLLRILSLAALAALPALAQPQSQGTAPAGSNAYGNPVQMGGVDATGKIRPIKVDTDGTVAVSGGGGGGGSGGSILPANPQSVRLSDGTNWQNAAREDGNLATIATNTTGAATAANQTTGNTSLSTIATNTGRIPAQGQALAANSLPVALADKDIVGPFTAQTTGNNLLTSDGSWFDAQGFNSFSAQIIASAGISAGQIIFEQTNDTTLAPNGITLAVDEQGVINANPIVAVTSIAASTNRMFKGALLGRFVRIRISTTFTGGTVRAVGAFSSLAYSGVTLNVQQGTAASLAVTASLAATQTLTTVTTVGTLTGSAIAEDAATTANPLIVGGIARTALPAATVVAGDAVRATSTISGQQVMKQFSPRELDFVVNATVTTNTQTAIRAAQAAGIRQNVTSITYQNTNATATTLTIQDASTTLITFSAPASMANPVQLVFPTPLFGTAATALNYTAGTTGANVLLNVTGFNSY